MTQVNPGAAVTGWRPVRRSDLVDLLAEIDRRLRRGTEIFLVGQTSQLYEGWIPEGHAAHLAAALPGRPALERAIGPAAPNGISVVLESPDEVIPLPEGHAGRARAVALAEAPDLRVSHFDPY
ncbi:MAG TPA: hypothetical protein VD793_11185, partial [Gemmatimonadales bacterium]|nr:hypothetical protein [Gemmatimonadales bacterium]